MSPRVAVMTGTTGAASAGDGAGGAACRALHWTSAQASQAGAQGGGSGGCWDTRVGCAADAGRPGCCARTRFSTCPTLAA